MPPAAPTTRLSTKGQVILPAELRKKRGWHPGQVLEVQETPEGLLLKPAPLFPRTEPGAAFGMLRPPDGRARTIEEMNEGIVDEVLARHARGRY